MNRFAAVLEPLRERLPLPQPARARVLLEVAADLEDLYAHYRKQGLDEVSAVRRAVETCNLSPEALAQLVGVHASPYARFLDRLSAQARGRWERAVLAALTALVAVTAGRLLVTAPVFPDAGPLAWPVALLLLFGLGRAVAVATRLYLKGDHDPRRVRRGLGGVLGAALALGGCGLAGPFLALYLAARRAAADPGTAALAFAEWLHGAAALAVVALTAAVAVGLVWFVLAGKVEAIESQETAFLEQLAGPRDVGAEAGCAGGPPGGC